MNADELKNADEIARALREAYKETDKVYFFLRTLLKDAADLIDSQQARLTASQRRAQDARNELCQKCGRYRDAHKGACDGCRWMA